MCKRRALRSPVITMGAGVYTFGEKLCVHIELLSFSAVREWRGNRGKHGESIGKGVWLHSVGSMKVSGCGRQEGYPLSIMLYLI